MAKPKAASAPMASEPALTVETFIREWLEAIAYSVRPRTWRRYSEYLQLHVVPALGETELGALGSRQIQTLYAQKVAEGLSSMSVLHLHSVLHRALRQAERWGLIEFNPTDSVDAPRPEPLGMNTLCARGDPPASRGCERRSP